MIKIRLQRRGRRKRPIHHIVVADSRSPRDGRIIEDLGRFDNIAAQNEVDLNEERAIYWLKEGAQPSDTVRSILKKQGILYKMHLMRWDKTEEEIEAALIKWREAREAKTEKEPTEDEKQRAMLEAEEKEYQKQLKKKAEEAAKEKARQEAIEAKEKEAAKEAAKAEEAEESKEASKDETVEEQPEEGEAKADEKSEVKAEQKADEASSKEPQEEETGSEDEAEPEEQEAAAEEEPEPSSDEEPEEKAQQASSEEQEEKSEQDASEQEEPSEAEETSVDMLAKEAIAHIEDTPMEQLEGFVTDDEDRVTVQRAWKSKQEEE